MGKPVLLSEFCRVVAVVQEARVDPSLLHLGLWTATVAALGGALLLAALCGLLAVLNAAASPGPPLCALPGLYVWNTLASKCRFAYLSPVEPKLFTLLCS